MSKDKDKDKPLKYEEPIEYHCGRPTKPVEPSKPLKYEEPIKYVGDDPAEESDPELEALEAKEQEMLQRRAGIFGISEAMDNLNQFIEEGRVVLNEARPIVTAVAEVVEKIKQTGRIETELLLPEGPILLTIQLPIDKPMG